MYGILNMLLYVYNQLIYMLVLHSTIQLYIQLNLNANEQIDASLTINYFEIMLIFEFYCTFAKYCKYL